MSRETRHRSAIVLAAAVLALGSAPRVRAGEKGEITFWTQHSTVKIRPLDPAGSGRSVHIKAAKNECESFQVAVAGAGGLTGVDVSASPLAGSEGAIAKKYIRLYRAAYMDVVTPSNEEGEVGRWPDALIPDRDPFFDEKRSAFPFDVPAGENRVIWVDVFVPEDAQAGNYAGALTIAASGAPPVSVPITLTVWDFTLPSTASLVSAFGYDGWNVLQGHFGNYDDHDQLVPLALLYAKSGLMHRISLEEAAEEDWSILPWPATAPIDWTDFDAHWGPLLDGVDLPNGLKGARLTSLRIATCGDNDRQKIAYWRNYVSHFRQKGWFDRLFDYTWDEPSSAGQFRKLKERAALIKQAEPELRVLVTTDVHAGRKHDLIGVVDRWVPVINEMHNKPRKICWDKVHAGDQRDEYDELLAAGNSLWWYQSCMSHGCDEVGGACHSGWPSYMIDVPAIYNRIMEWATLTYDISGELYFATNHAYQYHDGGANDPWLNLRYFGGNGDGTLFYPGRPEKIGGTHHVPVESIRLKMIREGMEDYEYLNLLKHLGHASFAEAEAGSVVTSTYEFTHDPGVLFAARERLAGKIVSSLPGGTVCGFVVDDETGEPLRRARVTGKRKGARRVSVRTDRSGNYRLDKLPEGQWKVKVKKVRYKKDRAFVDVSGSGPHVQDFELTPK